MDLRRGDNRVVLSDLIICYTWKNMETLSKNNKLKISEKTWNKVFELSGWTYLTLDMEDYQEKAWNTHW